MPSRRLLSVLKLTAAAWRADPRATAATCFAVSIAVLTPAALAAGSGVVVSVAVHAAHRGGGLASLVPVVVLLAGLFLLQQLAPQFARHHGERAGRRLQRDVADRVMVSLAEQPDLLALETRFVKETTAAIDTQQRNLSLRDAVVGLANLTMIRGGAVFALFLLGLYRWWLPLVQLLCLGAALHAVSITYQRQLVTAEGTSARLGRALYVRSLILGAAPAKETRIFGLSHWLRAEFGRDMRRAVAATQTDRGGAHRAAAVATAGAVVAQAITFSTLAIGLWNRSLTPGAFTTYAIAAIGAGALLITTSDLVHVATGGEVLAAAAGLTARLASEPKTVPSPQLPGVATIVFENVSFRYSESADWSLRDLDLTIEAKRSTAVVGTNGAGKTTLVRLLCGLYTPTIGRILVNGQDLCELDLHAWQRQCAPLFQNWVHLALSVRENVTFGAAGAADLEAVAAASGLDDVVAALPDGWDTVLSREFGGVELSGGQWQRVGLARALWALRAGASVLVLDEPTAALDVRGEIETFTSVLAAAADRTAVLVSHRFSTVRAADHIVVLDRGHVDEEGSHDELVARGGRYAAMFDVQAARYRAGDVR